MIGEMLSVSASILRVKTEAIVLALVSLAVYLPTALATMALLAPKDRIKMIIIETVKKDLPIYLRYSPLLFIIYTYLFHALQPESLAL